MTAIRTSGHPFLSYYFGIHFCHTIWECSRRIFSGFLLELAVFLLGRFNILIFGFLLRKIFFSRTLGDRKGKMYNCECCEFIGKARCDYCDCVAMRHIRKVMRKQCQWAVKEKIWYLAVIDLQF